MMTLLDGKLRKIIIPRDDPPHLPEGLKSQIFFSPHDHEPSLVHRICRI